MPRDVSGVYTAPFPDVVTTTTVASTVYNGFVHDVVTDLNTPRPVVAGGTGAASAAAARTALALETYGQVVTNYDSYAFLPGSFYSDAAATSPPVGGHAFVGTCAWVDTNNMFLTAYDRDDAAGSPGAEWFRQKKAGVWGSWAKSVSLSTIGTPSVNQFTTWSSSTALQGVTITGLVKGNGASAPSAATANADYLTPPAGTSILKGGSGGALANATSNTDYLPVSSPNMTGTPAAPNAAADTNTTQLATTAFVLGQAGAATPNANSGAGAAGSSLRYARQDHSHPQTGIATVKVQKFTATGTYTPSTGMLYCIAECWGAGGGGGGCGSASAGAGGGGGGGGAGSKARAVLTAAAIGASKAVTIGAKGTGGAAGVNTGAAGGDTSLGVLCIGKGGAGGTGHAIAGGASVAGGAGGVAGTGDVTSIGQSGTNGVGFGSSTSTGLPGTGGNSEVGAGGMTLPTATRADGAVAIGFAAGGAGGQSFSGNGASAGGDGVPGLVVVTEFCSQ